MITEYKIKNYHALFDKAYSDYTARPSGSLRFKESNYEKKVGIFFEKDICYVLKDGYDILEFNRSRDTYNRILYIKEPRLYVFFTKTEGTQATEQNACVYNKKEGVLAQTNDATIVYNEGKVVYVFMPSCLVDLSSECGKVFMFDEQARYFWHIFMRDLWYEDFDCDGGMPELLEEIDTAVSVKGEFGWTFDKMYYTDDVFEKYKKLMQTYRI